MTESPDPAPPLVLPRYFYWAAPPVLLVYGVTLFWIFSAQPGSHPERFAYSLAILPAFALVWTLVMIPCWPVFAHRWTAMMQSSLSRSSGRWGARPFAETRRRVIDEFSHWRLREDLAREYPWLAIYYYGGFLAIPLLVMAALMVRFWSE